MLSKSVQKFLNNLNILTNNDQALAYFYKYNVQKYHKNKQYFYNLYQKIVFLQKKVTTLYLFHLQNITYAKHITSFYTIT